MNTVPTNFTAADYCQALDRGEIIVNREYQRSDKVWPPAARSYLIETMLLGYPMPKLSLYQVTDVKTKKTFKEIVDGQQRSMAILDFYKNQLRLSSSLETEDVAGRTYAELDDEYKQRFLDYRLSLDIFVSTTPEEVREVFRRMNSYTIPLNPEEHRHASFQGQFKWFIYHLARRFDESFVRIGLFGPKQLVRMADTKLLTEICHALLYGIETTSKSKLDKLYKECDKTFPQEEEHGSRVSGALDQLLEWPAVHGGALMKPHIAYSLILAMIHMRHPVSSLQPVFNSPGLSEFNKELILGNLTQLAAALDNPDGFADYEEFVTACSSRTNVRAQRELRFTWLCKALASETL
jgi:hypothetical protein